LYLFVISDNRKSIDHSAITHHLDDDIFSSNLSDHCALLWRSLLSPFTRYNLLSNRLSNRFDNQLNICIHDTTGCQTGCQTRLTTGCIVYTAACQTGCTTRFDNRLNVQLFVQHGCQTGCTTGLSNRLYNRFDNRLYRVNGVLALSVAPWLVKVSKAYGRMVLVSGGTELTFLHIIGPHRSTIRRCGLLLQTEYIAWSVRRSFGLPVTIVSPVKTAEPIEISL